MNNKPRREKDYQQRINRVLVYIQENMNETITLDDLATVSHFSRFHFHRIFTAYESRFNTFMMTKTNI